jgi:hypothetical protein
LALAAARSFEVEGTEGTTEREDKGGKEAEDEVASGGDLKLFGGEQGTRVEALGDPTSLLFKGVLGLRTGLPNGALILNK